MSRADALGRGVCVQTLLAIRDPNPGCPLRVLNGSLKPVAVPKAQFVCVEAALRFIGELSKQYPNLDKKELSALIAINRCNAELNKDRGVAVVKVSERTAAFAGDCDNTPLKALREKYDADLKQKQDEQKEKEKAAKQAEKAKADKAKDAAAAADEAAAKPKRAPKRKAEEVEQVAVLASGEVSPAKDGASPKAKRVRKEKKTKEPAKPRDALGLDVDQAIGAVIEQDWAMAN